MNTNAILGIDVSKEKLDCALLLGASVHRKTINNNPKGFADLDAWLSALRAQNLHACLEATGRYGLPVSMHLSQSGRKVSVVNPALVYAHGRSRLARNKNDRADALLIADFCREKQPRPWLAASPTQRQLQELTRLYQDRTNDLVREKNRLKSAPQSLSVRGLLKKHLQQLEKQIDAIEAAIDQLIASDTSLQGDRQLLESIPGIGPVTAAAILGELWFYNQLDSARAAAAYAGLTPGQKQSGTSLKSSSLCRAGNKRLRKALYFPAIAAVRFNPLIQQKAIRWAAAGKRKMQIIAAAMHHLLRVAFGVLKNQRAFDPAWRSPEPAVKENQENLKEDKA